MAGQGNMPAAASQGRGTARKGTRAPNWNNQELALLFTEASQNPRRALGLEGSDLQSRQRRHEFFDRIAKDISALGVSVRDGHSAQRRFVEAMKLPRDKACSLIRQEVPVSEAIQIAVRGCGPHADMLVPMLEIFVQAANFGTDTLAGAAAALQRERGRPPAPPERPPPAQPPPQQPSSCTMAATAGPSHAEANEDVMAEALDDLSLASSSSEGQMAYQGAPAAQDVVEREQLPERLEDLSSSDGEELPAQGDMPLPPAPRPIPTPRPIPGNRAPEPIAEARPPDPHPVAPAAEAEAAGDNVGVPIFPRARGPRPAQPLPRDVGALWSQLQQAITDTGVQFRDAVAHIQTTLRDNAEASQLVHRTAIAGLASTIETTIRESTQSMTEAMGEVNRSVLQLHASTTGPQAASRGRGHRGRGQRGQQHSQGSSVPPPYSGHAGVQEEYTSGESQSGAEEAMPPQGGRSRRPQARRPAQHRSWSSPPHPPSKRVRKH